jgi:hypothetical protein
MHDDNYQQTRNKLPRPSSGMGIVTTIVIIFLWIVGSVGLGALFGIEYGLLETGFRIGYELTRP